MSTAIFLPNDILDPEELCARLKVRRTWIYEQMRPHRTNPIPTIKMGKFLRFHWPTVCEWLAGQQRAGMRKPPKGVRR